MNDISRYKGSIYTITNIVNGKVYVGQTIKHLRQRFSNHCSDARKMSNLHLHRAMRKYGFENFTISETERVYASSIELLSMKLDEREMFYIEQLNSMCAGYNLTAGGSGALGYKHSDERRKKIIDFWTAEKRRLVSERFNGEKNYMFGKKRPELSKRMRGKLNSSSRSVRCINTGQIFDTLTDAAKWCGLKSYSAIGHHLAGKHSTSGKHPLTGERLVWEFASEVCA